MIQIMSFPFYIKIFIHTHPHLHTYIYLFYALFPCLACSHDVNKFGIYAHEALKSFWLLYVVLVLKSLLRSRFLQSRRLVQDKRPSSSVAASELGFLRQRHTQWFKVFGFNAISTIRVASFFLFLRNIFPALTTMQGCFYYLPYLGVCVALCGGLFSYS